MNGPIKENFVNKTKSNQIRTFLLEGGRENWQKLTAERAYFYAVTQKI